MTDWSRRRVILPALWQGRAQGWWRLGPMLVAAGLGSREAGRWWMYQWTMKLFGLVLVPAAQWLHLWQWISYITVCKKIYERCMQYHDCCCANNYAYSRSVCVHLLLCRTTFGFSTMTVSTASISTTALCLKRLLFRIISKTIHDQLHEQGDVYLECILLMVLVLVIVIILFGMTEWERHSMKQFYKEKNFYKNQEEVGMTKL